MIKTEWKSNAEIEYLLKGVEAVSIVSCDGCAKMCGTGGAIGIEVLQELLSGWNKKVVFSGVTFPACFEDAMREVLTANSGAVSRSEVLVIAACPSGVKAAHLCEPGVPAIGVLDALGCEVLTEQNNIVARSICRGCGKCVIAYTGGICPLAECPAKMKYEPCHKAPEEGKQCTIDPQQYCVWKEIMKRGDLTALEGLREIHQA